jgi:hypothetical protein
MSERPSFGAPLWAALRQGTKEFAQLLPAFPDSARPIEEPGTLGNPTPQMITEQIGTLDGYNQMLDSYASRNVGRSEPEQGMER